MSIAWKEMRKSKGKFTILGSIVFLVALLTFMISGLANGLSRDNASFIQDFPDGTFYLTKQAEQTIQQSKISPEQQEVLKQQEPDAAFLSIQMSFLEDEAGKQHSVAIVADSRLALQPGEAVANSSLKKDGVESGARLSSEQLDKKLTVTAFADEKKYSHAAVVYVSAADYESMYRTGSRQLLFVPEQAEAPALDGLELFSKKQLLQTIPSYSAEQLSLNMIVVFLLVISGVLVTVFFYMMNVQKMSMFGILKAVGVKTGTLMKMMWLQMAVMTAVALGLASVFSLLFQQLAPAELPFRLPLTTVLQLAGLFFIIGWTGALLSGIQVKRAEPLQAIQRGDA